MVNLAPTEPWLYLIIYAGFMAFILTFGIILFINRRRKAKKIEESTKNSV